MDDPAFIQAFVFKEIRVLVFLENNGLGSCCNAGSADDAEHRGYNQPPFC